MTVNERLDTIIDKVEAAEALDPVTRLVRKAAERLLGSPASRDVLSGRALTHPLHPGLTLVSGGALLSATVLDLLGGATARRDGRTLIAVGLAAAVPTIASGWSDWLDTEDAESRIGIVHATTNTVALVAYARSWRARGKGRRGLLSSLSGATVLAAGGWLGGHLAFALGVGVDTTAFQSTAADWTDIAAADDVDDQLRQAELGGVAILLTRVEGKVVALADRCTHRGGPLSDGRRENACVVCPWHASAFSLATGAVRRGPATRPQPAYETRERDGRIEVRRVEPRALRRNPTGT